MNSRLKLALVGAASVIALSGAGLTHAFAQSTTASANNLVAKIASKFNLQQSEVQAVFDEQRKEDMAGMEQKFAEHLDQAVTDGKITAAQKDLIVAKQAELRTKMDAAFNLTDETARRAAMDAIATDLKKWTEDNDIDLKWVHGGGKGGHRFGGPGGAHGEMRFEMHGTPPADMPAN